MHENDYLNASRQFLSGGFHTDKVSDAEMHYMMNAAEVATKWCDTVKRGLFYGLDINQKTNPATSTSVRLKADLANLIHGIIGVFGEAGEMLEHLHKVLAGEVQVDKVNLLEEIGDLEWYLARVHDFIGSTPSQAWTTNIAKLDKRYPGRSFTAARALHRDLDAERAVLVDGAAQAEVLSPPAPGSVWVHYNGAEYHVLYLTNEPNDERYPLTVVYQGLNGKVWSRRADDWHRSMTPKTFDRTALVEEATADPGHVFIGGLVAGVATPIQHPVVTPKQDSTE